MVVSSELDAVKRVIDAFERSDWREIDVRSGNIRVHLATTDGSSPPPASTPRVDAASRPDVEPEAELPTPATATVEIPEGAHVVASPSPGIFWRAPEPGAPPFVEVGDVIDQSATLCIVEVMKLMNHLKADASGEIVAILVEDGVAVGKESPLFAIMTDGEQGS